ncbi:hypothetical protein J2805_004149 [Arthrobacter oryzae]|nr:hypothetical protein [Arthrobacter oryzae]
MNSRTVHRTLQKCIWAGAPPSLISSRNFEPLPVPQVALRTLKPSGDSMYQNDAHI